MLILTRRVGESIVIGGQEAEKVKIVILETRGGQVRLGIKAPKDIPVHREEIYEKIQASKPGQAVESFSGDDRETEETFRKTAASFP